MSGRSRYRRLARLGAFAVAIGAALAVTALAPTRPARVDGAAPASQRVYMVTDSVGLGAQYALPRAFPPDWQVVVDGVPAVMVKDLERRFLAPRLASSPWVYGDHVIVAAGYNYPYWDPEGFDRQIDSVVEFLRGAGVKHIHWVTLREVKPEFVSASGWRQIQPYYWYFPRVNAHLEAALERHPDLTLVGWKAVADQPGLTYDAIHLNNAGADLYSSIVRRSVDAAATRVADRATTTVHVPGGEDAAAAAVNIATTEPRTLGFLALHRCDQPVPNVSMHNYRRAEIVAHAGVVPLDEHGDFCVTTRSATNLVVDITGTFPRDGGFRTVTPTRWLDTPSRPGRAPLAAGTTIELDLADVAARAGLDDIADVGAVAVVATATEAAGPGWLRVATCGTEPTTTNVNYLDGFPVPNLAIVAPDADGRICVTTLTTTHVIVDLFGAFDAGAEVSAAEAVRVVDTLATGTPVAAGSTTVIDVADAGVDPAAAGVVLNVTGLLAQAPGFATAYPCTAGRPDASTLNIVPGAVAANAALVAPDAAGRICVYALTGMHLIVDVLGEVGRGFDGSRPVRALDTRS